MVQGFRRWRGSHSHRLPHLSSRKLESENKNNGRRHALVVAYYFPPMGLSGVQRTAKLVKYLPEYGWDVTVLTVEVGAYFAFDDGLLEDILGPGIEVIRTRTLDPTSRKKGRTLVPFPEEGKRRIFSRLSQFFLLPDNKIGWKKYSVKAGIEVARSRKIDLVFASAPPYTALLVGEAISSAVGIPLVLDYRDDWISNPRRTYSTSVHLWISRRLERRAVFAASVVLAINQTIADLVQTRHQHSDVRVIPQGFDPEDFNTEAEDAESSTTMTFLYTGMFYDAQKPDTFLKALSALYESSPEAKHTVRARFIGLFSKRSERLVEALGLAGHVEIVGYMNHADSLAALKQCDIAWMTIGHQKGADMISTGKLYEYMGSRRPIMALIPDGEAKTALDPYGASFIADPNDVGAVTDLMRHLLERWEGGTLPRGDAHYISRYDRRMLAQRVSKVFEEVIA